MQTRSGKTYTFSLENNKPKVDDIDVYYLNKMQTRSGKTYTISSSPDSLKENKPTVEINAFKCTSNERPTTSFASARVFNSIRNRIPSGFIQPIRISNELAKFLGKPVGTEISRTDVSRLINRYIQTNKLQDPQNGRIINPDSKLRSLLNLGKDDEVTYFNLQRYMRHHFLDSFVRPCQLSNELAKFIGKPLGTEMLRTDVARLINTYISVNNLQDPQNGRIINVDSNLRSLLNAGKDDVITYFNIQRYMRHHFLRLEDFIYK
jgi:chromatin remodeling complex protein RSC6